MSKSHTCKPGAIRCWSRWWHSYPGPEVCTLGAENVPDKNGTYTTRRSTP